MTSPIPHGFTLWHRRDRKRPWERIATAATEAELVNLYPQLGSGECVTLPADERPDEPRRAAK